MFAHSFGSLSFIVLLNVFFFSFVFKFWLILVADVHITSYMYLCDCGRMCVSVSKLKIISLLLSKT